jgi:hypothetical protein
LKFREHPSIVARKSNYSGFRVQGSGFRKYTRAGAMVFATIPHGRLGPEAIEFEQLLLSPEPRTLNPNPDPPLPE